MRQTAYEKVSDAVVTCNCVGPQNGEPLCPCQMKDVVIMHGRYTRIQDLGAAPEKKLDSDIGETR